jgi:hypothetical protein
MNSRNLSRKRLAVARSPVETLIHIIRGHKVMLDRDLATLYRVETFNLNKAVKRNANRFPEEFMFRLTHEEATNLKFQTGMSSWGGRRTLPYAFTEHGVAMLSSVLRSRQAVQMNIRIIKAFVRLREIVAHHKDLAARIEKLERGQERTSSVIEMLVEDIDRLRKKTEHFKAPSLYSRRRIGYIIDED